jgi:HSP20 family protein
MSIMRWRKPETLPTVFDEMDRWFDDVLRYPLRRAVVGDAVEFGPAVDVYETDTELVVKAQIPGVKKEDIELTVEENRLVISGQTRQEEEVNEEGYHRRELRYGSFRRAVQLPTAVNQADIKAAYDNGVLTVRAPKAPEAAANKIPIQ